MMLNNMNNAIRNTLVVNVHTELSHRWELSDRWEMWLTSHCHRLKSHLFTYFSTVYRALLYYLGFTVIKVKPINTFQVNNLSLYIIGVNPNNHIYLRYNHCSYFSRNNTSKMYFIKVFCVLAYICVEFWYLPPSPTTPTPIPKKNKIFTEKDR